MLFYIIFIHYVAIVSANWEFFSTFMGGFTSYGENATDLRRHRRVQHDHDYNEQNKFIATPSCDQLGLSSASPFIVIMLFKTSGRYLGVGSIIDKKTVLTASGIVVGSVHKPSRILCLAGRMNAWWGAGSQVQEASEIHLSGSGMALLKLHHPFKFSKFVLPIQIPSHTAPDGFEDRYDRHWGVFGIPRSSWNVPGEPAPKTNTYIFKVETGLIKKDDLDKCKAAYPDLAFNDTTMTCTAANGSFYWGCLGSPVVAIDPRNKIYQIGVIIRASTSEYDLYHTLVKVEYYEQWIRSNSLIGFNKQL